MFLANGSHLVLKYLKASVDSCYGSWSSKASAFWWVASDLFDTYMSEECDSTFHSELCISSKQDSGFNEAFLSSCLLKVNSTGCALGHMVQHSSHQLCLECQKHQQVLIMPNDAQSSTLRWSDWKISNTSNRLSFQGFRAFPWPLPHLCQN